jgi:hypothetical protein
MAYPRPGNNGFALEKWGHYVENPWAVDLALTAVTRQAEALGIDRLEGAVHDPCCGVGTIPSRCLERGFPATGSDRFDYGFGDVIDMFDLTGPYDNIMSNLPYGDRIPDGRKLLERVEHCLKLARRQTILILPITFHESRQRNLFFRNYPYEWWAPCSDRPAMPPPVLDGERDRHGAIIQPDNKGGKAPYGWFTWQRGGSGAMRTILLDLKPVGRPRATSPLRRRQFLDSISSAHHEDAPAVLGPQA